MPRRAARYPPTISLKGLAKNMKNFKDYTLFFEALYLLSIIFAIYLFFRILAILMIKGVI